MQIDQSYAAERARIPLCIGLDHCISLELYRTTDLARQVGRYQEFEFMNFLISAEFYQC